MRVLNVTQTYSPFFEFGGPPVKVRALSEALTRLGHEVTVLTADWGLQSRLHANGSNHFLQRTPFGWKLEKNGVRAIYLRNRLHYRALSWNPGVNRFCREKLNDFDVVHIFGLYDLLGPAVASACRSKNVPYVVEPIGMFLPIVRNFLLKGMYHRILGQTMLSGSSCLIATSKQEADEIASAGVPKGKIVLRRNGVETLAILPERGGFRAQQEIPADAKLILFLGRLSEKKSPGLLLQAFAMLTKSVRNTKLMLVFAGPDDAGMGDQLKRAANVLDVSSGVQFCGPVFGDKKWAAYQDADVFVLPSQNENFGNAAAEAAAMGTPVVLTEQCGIAPLLANRAALVVPHDAAAIANAMRRLLTEPELHARLAAGGQEVASRLDWQEPAQQMETLYDRIVDENRELKRKAERVAC